MHEKEQWINAIRDNSSETIASIILADIERIEKQEQEIERLNNIINELDKVIIEFKKQIEEERKNYREIIGNFVDKLQELKGNNNGVWVNNLLEVIKENNIEFGSDKE